MKVVIVMLFLAVFLSSPRSQAQDQEKTDSLYNIETLDGNEYLGEIVDDQADYVKVIIRTFGIV